MPFEQRTVTKAISFVEQFNDKSGWKDAFYQASMPGIIGLLNQLNQVSIYAHEIFSDVLNTTANINHRIKSAKHRVNSLEKEITKTENLSLIHI